MSRIMRGIMICAIAVAAAGCAGSVRHIRAEGALGPYSGSVVSGEHLYLSGKIGERGGTFEHEARTAIDALEQELARSGLGLQDLVAVTVYLTDLDQYGEFNEIYASRLASPYPARACVEVARLPGNARVEIQAVARRR